MICFHSEPKKKIFKTNDEVLWLCDWELEKKKDFCLKSKESKKKIKVRNKLVEELFVLLVQIKRKGYEDFKIDFYPWGKNILED